MSLLLAVLLASGMAQESSPLPACAEGWTLEVVARSPRLRHPSVVCCSPDGRIFVGEDRIDMEGPLEEPVDRILCLHPDGRTTVFAEGLGPVFGLLYLEGRLFVEHVPKFSVFRDEAGLGRDRLDLIECMNPTPSAGNGLNDHIPANFHLGMDGFFYMAVGQKGIYGATGRDGKRFEMREGGILRMRPDATGLEIYARGVRNIMDPAMTSDDQVFAYDNDDHTRTWKIKLLHMVDGGYYGFPWDFKPARPYTLGGISEFPSGAPTGTLAYTEDALPAEFRDNLILCDWGRRTVLRVRLSPNGATYRAAATEDLIPPGPNDFRPVGITTAPDGLSFYLCDWNFAGWKQKNDAGRLLKLTWTGRSRAERKPDWYLPAARGQGGEIPLPELLAGLSHPARSVRMTAQRRLVEEGEKARQPLSECVFDPARPPVARWHAFWALDALDGGMGLRPDLLRLLGEKELRVQVIRELGIRRVREAVKPLALALRDQEAPVRFQAAAALGRIADPEGIPDLLRALGDPDEVVRHGAYTALHRIGVETPDSWRTIGQGLFSQEARVRDGTLYAMRETYQQPVAAALAGYVRDLHQPPRARAAVLGILRDLELMPGPWDGRWWRNGPYAFAEDNPKIGPRIDKTVEWAGTPLVRDVLREALEDPSPLLREEAAKRPAAIVPISTGTSEVLFPSPAKANVPRTAPEPYASYASTHPGDPLRGRSVFVDPKGVACIRCHQVRGEGGELGPDLSSVGTKYDRAFLVESILYPSKQIAEGYQQTVVRMRDGRVLSGLVRSETPQEIALADSEGKRHVLRTSDIEIRKRSDLSLMPDNLHSALSLEDFADLVAFLVAQKDDEGFVPLLKGTGLAGWKKDPANEGHWTAKEGGALFYDGKGHDLWTEKSYGDFILKVDWRFPPQDAGGKPFVEKDAPVILPDGSLSDRTEKVLDAGDSGIFLRGSQKSQVNIWCWPIGSGEIYGYRVDKGLSPEVRAGATPKMRADRPPGEWNRFVITLKGERLSVDLNGKLVIDNALLPGIPAKGPIGIQHPGNPLTVDMPLEFRNLLLKELP